MGTSHFLNTANICILTDGGGKYGFGHLRRSLTLYDAFKFEDFQVTLIPQSDAARMLVPISQHKKIPVDAYILDVPYPADDLISGLRSQNAQIIALDYFGKANPDLTISVFEHHDQIPPGYRVSGLQYAIIRPELLKMDIATSSNSVLVMIGGSDILSMGTKVALELVAMGYEVDLIQGPAVAEPYQDLREKKIKVWESPKNLPRLMQACSWAVANGGTSMLELLAMKKAVFVVPQTEAENQFASLLYQSEGVLGIGSENLFSPTLEKKTEVAIRAGQLVDGLGIARIIKLVRNLLYEK
jgi:spore coat polysaccharide biosynthesis predicted glycosyltransferase SpsG